MNLKRCLNEDPDTEGHPISTLNMELIKQLTKKMSPVDYLQVLQDPLLKDGAKKRKRVAGETVREGSGKKVKIRLKI